MSFRHLFPDLVRRLRIPATRPPYIFQAFSSGSLLVGTTVIPITQEVIPATYIILVAGLTNVGVLYVGGPNMSAANGLELDAGRGVSFATPEFAALQHEQTVGSLGAGLMRYADGMAPQMQEEYWQAMSARFGRPRYPKVVLNLRDIRVVGDVGNQELRYVYVSPFGDF